MTRKSIKINVTPSFRKMFKKKAIDEDISIIELSDKIARRHKKKRYENNDEFEMFW